MNTFKNKFIPASVIILFITIVFGYSALFYSSEEIVEITVTKTERIVESYGSGENANTTSKYLVFTETETFENTDSWLYMKFSSSDLYAELEEGKTYKVKVAGWRVPFLSLYRNIIQIQ